MLFNRLYLHACVESMKLSSHARFCYSVCIVCIYKVRTIAVIVSCMFDYSFSF